MWEGILKMPRVNFAGPRAPPERARICAKASFLLGARETKSAHKGVRPKSENL
jgi:hypothetical protein